MIFPLVRTMPRKGGKIIGLAKDERGKPTKEVPPTDENAVQWFDTNTYKTLTREEALSKLPSVSPVVGLGRSRKSRRGKKSRKVTRRR